MTADPQVIRSERHVKVASILEHDGPIIVARWSERAMQEQPAGSRVHHDVLLDHFPVLLRAIAESLAESLTGPGPHCRLAADHGLQRWQVGWDVSEVVRDYQILRLVIVEHLENTLERALRGPEIMAIGLVLDEAITVSVRRYVEHREHARVQEERQLVEREKAAVLAHHAQQTDALREAAQRKDEFLAILGHELRNPLAPLRNALHVLRLRGNEPDTRDWAADMLERQVHHMTRLVDDLLDASRISRNKVLIRRERLDLAGVCRTTGEDHRNTFHEAGITFKVDVPDGAVCVLGDAMRIAQVIGNLLNNAVKFTDRGGQVTLTLRTDPTAGRAMVSVQDTGIGIEPAMLPNIFDSFMQADRSLERSRGGLGLGLALVRGLVELHGGGVEAFSEGPGAGTRIDFWLPLCEADDSSPSASALDNPST